MTRQSKQAGRFLRQFEAGDPDECWPWLGTIIHRVPGDIGYGQVHWNGKRTGAHRASYELSVGPIPQGYHVDHVYARGCRRTDCVNPAHLEAVPPAENSRRRDAVSSLQRGQTVEIEGEEYAPLSEAARRSNLSRRVLSRRVNDGTVRFVRISSRRILVHLGDASHARRNRSAAVGELIIRRKGAA